MRYFIFKLAGVASLIIQLASCSILGGLNKKEFVYYNNDKKMKLVFRLPRGTSDENFKVGNNGAKEQFYYLGNGAVFYVAYHINWQTVNSFRIDTSLKAKSSIRNYTGTDDKGLHWKEIQFEQFLIGYAYVSTARRQDFDEAINTVRVK